MNIFDKLKQRKADSAQSDLSSYYQFLKTLNVNNPSEADQLALDGFMSRLGKDVASVEIDRNAVKGIEDRIQTLVALKDADAVHTKAHERHAAVCLERQEFHHAITAKVANATIAVDRALHDLHHRGTVRRELSELKESNPILWAVVVGDAEKKLKL